MSQWSRIPSRRHTTAWSEPLSGLLTAEEPMGPLQPSTIYRFVMGVDDDPVVMPQSEVDRLGDPMGLLLRAGKFPLTVEDLLAEIDAVGTLPLQRSFLLGEAGQIPPSEASTLARDLRFAITRARAADVDLFVSTSAVDNPATAFLQVAAWDGTTGVFNFYMRMDQTWVWSGDSYSALEPGSRGEGCFDSHVNGSLVMKELKAPWLHWQSMNATILVAPDHPLRQNPLYTSLSGAEDLELTVRQGVRRWTAARLRQVVTPAGEVSHPDRLLRQLCTTTTVNLASSATASSVIVGDPSRMLTPPPSFWLNVDALLNDVGIPVDLDPPRAPGRLYVESLLRYDFALVEGNFRRPGDTFFAFAVPEAAFEDNEVVRQMVRAKIVTAHFVASVLMVDFPNPVFSPARAKLLDYMPTSSATLDPAGGGLSNQIAEAITQAAEGLAADSPEAQFVANWQLGDAEWQDVFATKIQDYLMAVASRIGTAEGFDDYARLAESRRREFKRRRLNEFNLTLPATSIPLDSPLLQMHQDGTVGEKPIPSPA